MENTPQNDPLNHISRSFEISLWSNSEELKEDEKEVKGQFSNPIEYWLTWLGSAVGFGNLWRFPSVLYSNGGGAFFIPYFTWII